ncbi:hypothetical protein HY797_01110 [Candidatus Falkowbacteria bacterium]|nr:hypothetical protein [Candidatus Falkowbacteria bacterium]
MNEQQAAMPQGIKPGSKMSNNMIITIAVIVIIAIAGLVYLVNRMSVNENGDNQSAVSVSLNQPSSLV